MASLAVLTAAALPWGRPPAAKTVSGPYRIPAGWWVKRDGIPPGVRSEGDCDAHIGPKALAVRAEVEAAINRPTTKAPMTGAKKRKSRKQRRRG